MRKILFLTVVVASATMSQASFTIATFSDPATTSSTPMFAFDSANNTLDGGWTLPGLTMLTPGMGGGSINNVSMAFDQLALTAVINGTFYTSGAGRIRFYTNDINNPFLKITFTSASFLNPTSLGGSNLTANGVQFSGPNVPLNLSQEQFAFSFANPEVNGPVTTYTSSFTSSAVPEPATLLAIGTGLVALARKRRKA